MVGFINQRIRIQAWIDHDTILQGEAIAGANDPLPPTIKSSTTEAIEYTPPSRS
jgi:hypothetical protein